MTVSDAPKDPPDWETVTRALRCDPCLVQTLFQDAALTEIAQAAGALCALGSDVLVHRAERALINAAAHVTAAAIVLAAEWPPETRDTAQLVSALAGAAADLAQLRARHRNRRG